MANQQTVKKKVLSRLINEGAELDVEIKALTARIKEIKGDLTEKMDVGTYVTEEGHSVTISESPKFSDISPENAKKALREKRLGKNFMGCIKVAITPLKRYLSDQEIGTLREVLAYSRRYSFK